jgi:hypothetical protein
MASKPRVAERLDELPQLDDAAYMLPSQWHIYAVDLARPQTRCDKPDCGSDPLTMKMKAWPGRRYMSPRPAPKLPAVAEGLMVSAAGANARRTLNHLRGRCGPRHTGPRHTACVLAFRRRRFTDMAPFCVKTRLEGCA